MVRQLTVFCFAVVLARAEVHAPSFGWVHYPDGNVRPVLGLPGAFVLGDVSIHGVTQASFSKQGGLLASASRLMLMAPDGTIQGDFQTSEARPVVNIGDDPLSAIAWLPSTHEIVYQSADVPLVSVIVQDPLPGEVSSIERRAGKAILHLGTTGADLMNALVSLDSGQLLSWQTAPAFETPSSRYAKVLGIDSKESQSLHVEAIGSGWVHVWQNGVGRQWAVNSNAEPAVFELPAGGAK
ncbi:MAG: hypothetical protein JO061_11410 [Acidobacteriaceae bacterium]|nr:hypothetical protein [Acidobacteriaceae bacterium]